MWATPLRCPSCPQRYWTHVQLMFDQASARLRVDRLTRCNTNDGRTARAWLDRWQHAGENFEPQVLFVTNAVGATLNHADLVVEALDEAERDFVLGPAVGSNAVPMTIDHGSELVIRLEPLPLEAGAPVLEEASCPALALI